MLAAHDDLLQARSRLLLFATQHALRLGASESQLNIERVVVSCVHLSRRTVGSPPAASSLRHHPSFPTRLSFFRILSPSYPVGVDANR
jgi:hypothetical protein